MAREKGSPVLYCSASFFRGSGCIGGRSARNDQGRCTQEKSIWSSEGVDYTSRIFPTPAHTHRRKKKKKKKITKFDRTVTRAPESHSSGCRSELPLSPRRVQCSLFGVEKKEDVVVFVSSGVTHTPSAGCPPVQRQPYTESLGWMVLIEKFLVISTPDKLFPLRG